MRPSAPKVNGGQHGDLPSITIDDMQRLRSFLFTLLLFAAVYWVHFATGDSDSIRWQLWLPVMALIFAVVYVFEPGEHDTTTGTNSKPQTRALPACACCPASSAGRVGV